MYGSFVSGGFECPVGSVGPTSLHERPPSLDLAMLARHPAVTPAEGVIEK
jgi:hypothetical protein